MTSTRARGVHVPFAAPPPLPGNLFPPPQDIPFPNAAFDYAYSNVLDHIFDRDKFAAEVCRVVKPGGLFFASLYPGESKGGNDAWTARQANSLDNEGVFVASMKHHGFDRVDAADIKEDMDLTGVGASVWHQVIRTLYLRRSDARCAAPGP